MVRGHLSLHILLAMSRSRKKYAIVKDKTGHSWYNRRIRRCHRQQVKSILSLQDVLDYELTSPRAIVNDYDICDYVIDYEHQRSFWKRFLGDPSDEYLDKIKRK